MRQNDFNPIKEIACSIALLIVASFTCLMVILIVWLSAAMFGAGLPNYSTPSNFTYSNFAIVVIRTIFATTLSITQLFLSFCLIYLVAARYKLSIQTIPSVVLMIGVIVPFVIPPVVFAFLWKPLVSSTGPINTLLSLFSFPTIPFLSTKGLCLVDVFCFTYGDLTFSLVDSWVWIVFMACSSILYFSFNYNQVGELIRLDTVNPYIFVRHVFIPLVRNWTKFLLLFNTARLIAEFNIMFVFFGTNPLQKTPAIATYITAIELFKFQESAIISIFSFATCAFFLMLSLKFIRRKKVD